MVTPSLLFALAIIFLPESARAYTEVPSTTVSSETTGTEQWHTTTSGDPKVRLCQTCNCTELVVDCTKRNLENHFPAVEWPSKSLDKVTFKENFLVHLKPFPKLTINRLILSDNRITKIDDKAFKEIRNLTELDLSHNQLTSELLRPAVFEGPFSVEEYEPLGQLRLLNLANNALHTLKQDIFEHVSDLRVLILSGNPLTTIDQGTANAISQLLYLEDLDLSYCDLASLPDHLFHAPSHLKRLNLNGNVLKSPPSALEDCKALEYLSLDENPFESLDRSGAFPVMSSLKELSLCSLPHLTSIGHGVFSQLTALESLSLRNCPGLTDIDEDAFVKRNAEGAVWPPLKRLDISDNSLRYLSFGLVGRWDHLEKLVLINNEWRCDCDNQYLVSIVTENYCTLPRPNEQRNPIKTSMTFLRGLDELSLVSLCQHRNVPKIGTLLPSIGEKLMGKEIAELKCSTPPEHAGKNLTSLANRKLRCLDLYGARPERDAAILIGVLIGLFLAIPIALTLFVFWRRGFFFCGSQGPASFSRAFYKRAANDDEI